MNGSTDPVTRVLGLLPWIRNVLAALRESRILLVLFAAIISNVLSGCATTTSVDPKALSSRRVGIVSVAGMYLTQKNVGITVFGNEYAAIDVSAWSLDLTYAATLAQSLQRKAQLTATVLHPNVDTLRPIFDPASSMHVAFDLNPNWGKVESAFRDIAAANDIDTLVVLAPISSGDYFGTTNQILYGLGIYTRSMGDRTMMANIHLFTQVVVISGKTGKALGYAPVSRAHPSAMGGPLQRGQPATGIADGLARTPTQTMTEDQRRQVRARALSIPLDDALDATVAKLFTAS